MEVDHTVSQESSVQTNPGGTGLKRSNSAPMINKLVATTKNFEVSCTSRKTAFSSRTRRFSSASNQGKNLATPSRSAPSPRSTDPVSRIRQEENITDREAAHEREVHDSWQVTHSWDHLSLTKPNSSTSDSSHRPRSLSESLHILTSPSLLCGSPSPTRPAKQCFSPSLRIAVNDAVYGSGSSPSPTRKPNFIRSLSPIATQCAPFKRKLETDGGERSDYLTPAKRFHLAPSTPDQHLLHPLARSVSTSSTEDNSPEVTATPMCPSPLSDAHLPSPPLSRAPPPSDSLPASPGLRPLVEEHCGTSFMALTGQSGDVHMAVSEHLQSVLQSGPCDMRTEGFEEQRIPSTGLRSEGFEEQRIQSAGLRSEGFEEQRIQSAGLRSEGFEEQRIQSAGLRSEGFEEQRIQSAGLRSEGFEEQRIPSAGLRSEGFEEQRIQSAGLRSEGFEEQRIQSAGLRTEGFEEQRIQSAGLRSEDFEEQRIQSAGLRTEGFEEQMVQSGACDVRIQGFEEQRIQSAGFTPIHPDRS